MSVEKYVMNMPRTVYSGVNALDNLTTVVKNAKKVAIFTDRGILATGLVDLPMAKIREAGKEVVVFSDLPPEPTYSQAQKLVDEFRASGADFIVAVGGGSVIDSSKAIGYGLYDGGDIWDFYLRKRTASGCVPVGAVLTIAAAGSEMSQSCVITNEDGWIKRGYSSNYARCRFAVLNPELTYTLPWYQTACGCVDIIMHIMERYFTPDSDTMLTDGMSEQIIRTVMYNARILKKDPENYNARAQVMWAGSLAHNGLLSCGVQEDWASHQLEHELSGLFDVAHGAGLAAVWGSWARYVVDAKPERFAQLAVNILGVPMNFSDVKGTALAGIEAMERFFMEIDMPVNLHELGVEPTQEQIQIMARKCTFNGERTVGGIRKLGETEIAEIYRMAL